MSLDWSIHSRKRQRNSTTPAPRKRVRRDDDVPSTATRSAPRPRMTHQQTLTQIDFVKSSSFERLDGGDDWTELEPLSNPVAETLTRRTPNQQAGAEGLERRNLKRNSTLTQIDFVKNNSSGNSEVEDVTESTPLDADMPARLQGQTSIPRRRIKKRDSTLTQMDFFDGQIENIPEDDDTMLVQHTGEESVRPPVPMFDGANDTPAQSVQSRQQLSSSAKRNKRPSNSRKSEPRENESHDYQPRRKRKVEDTTTKTPDTAKRRRSGRIAAASVSKEDAVHNPLVKNVAETSLTSKPDILRRHPVEEKVGVPAKVPVLEVQETVFFEPSPPRPRHTIEHLPTTPSKSRDRVPSSQTPETITPGTRKSKRQPLAELSTNIPLSPFKSTKTSPNKLPAKKSPVRKICVLKVPSRAHFPYPARIEDSQHDIYSLQPTSPVSRKDFGAGNIDTASTPAPSSAKTSMPVAKNTENDIVIEPSPTPNSMRDTQKSLPDITELLGFSSPKSKQTVSVHNDYPQLPEDITAKTMANHMPGEHQEHAPANIHNEGIRLDKQPVNMIPELGEITTDELSELGSPIPNETQFDKKLFERISSPTTSSQEVAVRQDDETSPSKSVASRSSMPVSSLRRTPLPTPRLVHTSPVRSVERQTISVPVTSVDPPILDQTQPTQPYSFGKVRITRVPLNDTISSDKQQTSSSSPFLPPPPLPVYSTQRTVHPASMPHPSQVSTQAPSQGYFPTSSAPQSFLLPQAEIERIVIKDSSSLPARLSQYQQYITQQDNGHLEDDSDQEDDLDLDPASFKPLPPPNFKKHMTADTEATTVILGESDTQTQTQGLQTRTSFLNYKSATQSSPIVLNATTRSQRDARLDVIALVSSSSSPLRPEQQSRQVAQHNENTDALTPRAYKRKRDISSSPSHENKKSRTTPAKTAQPLQSNQLATVPAPSSANRLLSSPTSSSIASSPSPRPLKRRYTPIPGFDNETQSDFTQGGHVTAAYVHRMREDGLLPAGFVPKPYKAKNWRVSSSMKGKKRN